MPTFFTQAKIGTTELAIIRLDDDGTPWWLGAGEQDEQYLAWLAEGNTPEEWNPDGTL